MAETCFAVTQSLGPATVTGFDRDTLALGRIPVAVDASARGAVELAGNGPPIAGVEVGILTATGVTTAPSTAVGEIVLRGDVVFRGYHDASDLTAAAMTGDGWYRSGDLGFLRAGELHVCGRLKEVVIVHGRNYYCHDIEALVSEVPGIVPGRVVAIGAEGGDAAGEALLIIAEPSQEGADRTGLRRAVKAKVSTHLDLTPRSVEFVPRGWLVKTTSGKLSRVENARRLREGPAPGGAA